MWWRLNVSLEKACTAPVWGLNAAACVVPPARRPRSRLLPPAPPAQASWSRWSRAASETNARNRRLGGVKIPVITGRPRSSPQKRLRQSVFVQFLFLPSNASCTAGSSPADPIQSPPAA